MGRMLRVGVLCAVILCVLTGRAVARSDDVQIPLPQLSNPRVLILHSYHQGFTWTDNVSRGIDSVFAQEAGEVELIFEFMDVKRLYTDAYLHHLAELYRFKYADRQIDVIIASDDHALDFLLDQGRDLFPGVPVVFCAVNGYDPVLHRGDGRALTGVVETIDIRATLEVALQLHPETQEVAVITDRTLTGRALKADAQAVFEDYQDRVQFRYLEHLTMEKLQRQVATLSDDTIVFAFIFSQDQYGRVFSHEYNLERLAAHCDVPIYSVWEFYLGHGIVGGMLTSGRAHGEVAARMALRVLDGEDAADIPVVLDSPNRYMFDHAQMARFGIPTSSLPAGSVVINAPFSFYDQYKGVIWGAVALVIVLLVVVAVLLISSVMRKRAQMERNRLLVQVQDQAQRVQHIVETVPEGVLLLDAKTRVVLANPSAQAFLDVLTATDWRQGALTHLGGCPLGELLTSPPLQPWHELTQDSRNFEVIARPLEVKPENEGWVLVIRDVTQEREIERRVQQQERLAAVGQLASGIAHDFNNIMAVIVLYTQMALKTSDLLPKVRERLETVAQQAWRATELIQQVLDFSRRTVIERQPLDLLPFLKEQVKLLRRTLPENIEIALRHDMDVYTIHADPTRIQQLIMNLALNARDAMLEGGTLQLWLDRINVRGQRTAPLPEMEAGEWVQLTVADTGSGIPPDLLPRIFDPFFTTKPPGQGSGLGLAQVHGIVKLHEGEIDVDSQVGKGTTFTLYFPALPLEPVDVTAQVGAELVQGQGQTILVVEDDAATREALVDSLALLNYRVLSAPNGREALAVLEARANEVALVLSDVVMPEMGGVALLRALKQRGLSVPFVLMSGHPLKQDLEDLKQQGLAGWMPKPPNLERLAEALAEGLKSAAID